MSGKRTSRRSAPRTATSSRGETDWARLARKTDADIRQAIAGDDDTFVPDAEWWARARVVVPGGKRLVSLRIDDDVLRWFRRQGKGYQTRINAVLRSYMDARKTGPAPAPRRR